MTIEIKEKNFFERLWDDDELKRRKGKERQ